MARYYTEQGEQIDLEATPSFKGGEGAVYMIVAARRFRSHYCAKIYHKSSATSPNQLQAVEAKIRYMLQHQPQQLEGANWRISWPVAMLYTRSKQFVGFIMPLAYAGSVKLTELILSPEMPPLAKKKFWKAWTVEDWLRFDPTTLAGLKARLKLVVNVCYPIHLVHQEGSYVFVDMKPDNILVNGVGQVTICDMDSIQIMSQGKLLYPSLVCTPDYTPPEKPQAMKDLSGKVVSAFDETWDRYSFGVLVYQMLFLIHPFSCTAGAPYDKLTSTIEKVSAGLYVHGSKRRYIKIVHQFHQNLSSCPTIISEYFFRCFDTTKGLGQPSLRPSLAEWGKMIYKEVQKIPDAPSKPKPPRSPLPPNSPEPPSPSAPPQSTFMRFLGFIGWILKSIRASFCF